jgi:hypothetical protein
LITTLRHVVRETGYHHTGQTPHDRKLGTKCVDMIPGCRSGDRTYPSHMELMQ